MNPLAVLRASDAMTKPVSEHYQETVAAEMLLADMLDTLAESDRPLAVSKKGEIVGELSTRKGAPFSCRASGR